MLFWGMSADAIKQFIESTSQITGLQVPQRKEIVVRLEFMSLRTAVYGFIGHRRNWNTKNSWPKQRRQVRTNAGQKKRKRLQVQPKLLTTTLRIYKRRSLGLDFNITIDPTPNPNPNPNPSPPLGHLPKPEDSSRTKTL